MKKFLVKTKWDEESSVLMITSEHVPGLVTKASTAQELEVELSELIPELLEKRSNKIRPVDTFINKVNDA